MNEIRPEDVLAGLDWQAVTCQRTIDVCHRTAVVAVEIHAIDVCDATGTNDLGNVIGIFCKPCFEELVRDPNRQLRRLSAHGRPHCRTCQAPLRTTTDVLRATKAI